MNKIEIVQKMDSTQKYIENELKTLKNLVLSFKSLDSRQYNKPIEIDLGKIYYKFRSLHILPTDIFGEIGHNLYKLNMDNLRLITLNNIFDNCYRLNDVSINNNNIIYLDEYVFKNCIYLSEIKISHNHIESIPQHLFINSWNLTTVNFSNNRIQKLPDKLFFHCPNLKQLDFEGNQLINIPDNLLHSKTKLTSLNIYRNKLIKLPQQLLDACSTLHYLCADVPLLCNIIDCVDNLDNLNLLNILYLEINISDALLSYLKNTCKLRRNKYDSKSYGWHIRKYAIISLTFQILT